MFDAHDKQQIQKKYKKPAGKLFPSQVMSTSSLAAHSRTRRLNACFGSIIRGLS